MLLNLLKSRITQKEFNETIDYISLNLPVLN